MTGSHTLEAIPSNLEDIHSKFSIWQKIVRTATDNGANFVKAFVIFGEVQKEVDSNDNDEPYDDEFIKSHDVGHALNLTARCFICHRISVCTCHTLNLIATRDAEKAEQDDKKLSRSACGKCQGMPHSS